MDQSKKTRSRKSRSERREKTDAPKEEGNTWNSGSGNVVEWLAKKTTEPGQDRGALEFLKAQTKSGGMVPKPRSQQDKPTAAKEASEATSSGAGLISMLAKKIPDAVKSDSANTTIKSTEKPKHTRVEAKRKDRRHDAKVPAKTAEEVEKGISNQMQEVQKQQEQLMRDHPEYAQWVSQQTKLQQEHETTRMDVLTHLQQQGAVNVDRVETERIDIPMILDLVDRHQVTFICTDTGSGKSTSVPKALLESSANTKIVSTQPRRTATTNIASRVASLRNERVGEDVGYWIRGEKKGDEQTRLWYMTSYTLLLHLLNNPLHPHFTHIILDEFHERQPDLEVTVALLKLCLQRKTANFKLILMSATLNTEDWENYFEGLSVAVYKQSEPDHPIHNYFMEEISALVGMPYQPPGGFVPTMVDQQVLENHMFVAQHLIMFLNMVSNPQHSILVFLPGRANVEHFVLWAEMNLRDRVDIIPWHSAVELSTIEACIRKKSSNRQKLYLATDIAEVSITLPDVVFVVDLALVKRPFIQPSVAATVSFPPLMTQWISKGSVAQRRGRVGRVQQGFYFCLLSKTLVPMLNDFNTPPIQHSRIDELALHALQLVANPVAIFGICKGQPMLESIVSSMNTLTHLGCIIPKEDKMSQGEDIGEVYSNSAWSPIVMEEAKSLLGEDAEVTEYVTTFIGRLLQLLPVSSQQGMLIFYGFITGLESLMILAAAVSNCISPFSLSIAETAQPQRGRGRGRGGGRGFDSVARAMESTERSMKEQSRDLRSDLVAVIGAVLMYKIKQIELDGENLSRWCRDNQLSQEKLLAIVDLDTHIKYELAGFIPFRDIDDPYALATQLDKVAPAVAMLHCAAFASNSLEVTAGNGQREAAMGLFTPLKAMPDLHMPSCFRWEHQDIVVPINISLRHSNLLVGYATAMKSHKQFWLSLLLFSHRVSFATFSDDTGMYMQFRLKYNSVKKSIETDSQIGHGILEFRRRCSRVCASLRLRYGAKEMFEEEFDSMLMNRQMPPMLQQQRELMMHLSGMMQAISSDGTDVAEVEENDEELDNESVLSFAI